VSRKRRDNSEIDPAIRETARRRVEAVWASLDVLCPDLEGKTKKILTEKVLDLCAGSIRIASRVSIQITPGQPTEIIWRNIQCINPRCPMLLFSNQIADELNEFFKEEE
jgi:hypothetical protein